MMKNVVTIFGLLCILAAPAYGASKLQGPNIINIIKRNVANGDYKIAKISGSDYVVTMTTGEYAQQAVYIAHQGDSGYKVVATVALPLFGADEAQYSVNNNVLSITYGYGHQGTYSTTFKFNLFEWPFSKKFDSSLIEVDKFANAYGHWISNDGKEHRREILELDKFDFRAENPNLKIWYKSLSWAAPTEPRPDQMYVCQGQGWTKDMAFYAKHGSFPCRPDYAIKIPNTIKLDLNSINLEKFSNWISFISSIIENANKK